MARKKPTAIDLTEQSVALAEFAAQALVAAEQLAIKKKVVDGFYLDDSERAIAADLPGLSATIKKKLAKKDASFTITDTASIVIALAESLLDGEPLKRLRIIFIAKKLMDCLQSNVVSSVPAKANKSKPSDTLYQFKITLLSAKPRSGDESRSRTAPSMNFTNTSRRQWAGPTRTCTSSTSRANATAIPNCSTMGSRTSMAAIPPK